MKLTDEQFESILTGAEGEPADLDERDRARLVEARAVRSRVRSAFGSVSAGEALAGRISAAVRAGAHGRGAPSRKQPRRVIRLRWRLAPIGVAAAVLVVAAVMFNFTADRAAAGPAELARIHNDNLTAAGEFLAVGDAAQIAEHLRTRLGFTPKVVSRDGRTRLVGCSVAKFRGRRTATYLVTVDGEKVSVIVTGEPPDEMGLSCGCGCGPTDCNCFHTGRCNGCNIVSVRIGSRSYSAVGTVSAKVLERILHGLRG